MAIGAYENPTSYGVDFTQGTDILQKGMQDAAASLRDIEKQRVAAREKLEGEFAEFKDDTYLDKLQGVGEGINNSIRESVGSALSLGDFSNLSPDDKARMLNSTKEAKAGITAISTLIESAKNNVLDPRIPAEKYEFISDINNGRNLEYKPTKNGIGFTLVHTDSKGKKHEYDAGKLAMMVTQFGDVDEVFEDIDTATSSALESLQKKKKGLVTKGKDIQDSDIRYASNALYSNMPLRNQELYFAEYVMKGADLNPKYKMVDGERVELSDQEKEKLSSERKALLGEHLFNELKNQLVEVNYEAPRDFGSEARVKANTQVKIAEMKNASNEKIAKYKASGKGEEDYAVDEDLWNGLSGLKELFKEYSTPSKYNEHFDYLRRRENLQKAIDKLDLNNAFWSDGKKKYAIQFVNPSDDYKKLDIYVNAWDSETSSIARKALATVDLSTDKGIRNFYDNLVTAKSGEKNARIPSEIGNNDSNVDNGGNDKVDVDLNDISEDDIDNMSIEELEAAGLLQ